MSGTNVVRQIIEKSSGNGGAAKTVISARSHNGDAGKKLRKPAKTSTKRKATDALLSNQGKRLRFAELLLSISQKM